MDARGDAIARNPTRPNLLARSGSAILLVAVCLVASAVRVHELAGPLMRWDEGWSVAHASRSLGEIVEIASWEVHPPLFYLALKPWLALGRNLYLVRLFPVLVGVLTVPVAYLAANRWLKRRSVAWLAAALTALAPGLVYYAQVVRMYPLVVLWLLLTTLALLGWLDRGQKWALVGLWLAGSAALYTFYYSAFAVLGLYLYGLLAGRKRRTGLLVTGALTVATYIPWLVYAGAGLIDRMGRAAPAETIMPVRPWELLASAWTALTFDFSSGGWAALAVLGILAGGALLALRPGRHVTARVLMPLLTLLTATVGIALGSGFYFFAPRLLTPAMPFLLLLVAWGLDTLLSRSRTLFALAAAILVITYWPTSSRFVYEKSLEVSGSFDPHEYHAALSGQAGSDDLVFFNELALAGWYEMDRGPQDAPWGYALRWTPIIEPMAQIERRVEESAGQHPRLWFVLYKGGFGPGQELKEWLDSTLYPTRMAWGSESLFLTYLPPADAWRAVAPEADFGGLIRLETARFGAAAGPQGQVPIALRWRALDDPLPDLRIVVQAWDETGTVLAQRDVQPDNWGRPADQWKAGDVVEEHHGLVLAAGSDTPVHLAVSVYETAMGEPLLVNGDAFLELGAIPPPPPA